MRTFTRTETARLVVVTAAAAALDTAVWLHETHPLAFRVGVAWVGLSCVAASLYAVFRHLCCEDRNAHLEDAPAKTGRGNVRVAHDITDADVDQQFAQITANLRHPSSGAA